MAQKRMIDKKISISEKVADLDLVGKLLYTWMIPHADDVGLLQGKARTIKGLVMPLEDLTVDDIKKQLDLMIKLGLIKEVQHNGKKYYYIVDFEKNQTLKHDRQPQTILDFEHDKDAKTSWSSLNNLFMEISGIHLEDIGNHLDTEEKISKEKISKEKREEEKPHKSLSYLMNIPLPDLEEFSKAYSCSQRQGKSKGEDLFNYCKAKGKKYSDYKALLRNAIKKDFGERIPTITFESPDLNYKPISKEKMEEFRKQRNLLAGKKSLN